MKALCFLFLEIYTNKIDKLRMLPYQKVYKFILYCYTFKSAGNLHKKFHSLILISSRENYAFLSAWEYKGQSNWELHKEQLNFVIGQPTQRGYKL